MKNFRFCKRLIIVSFPSCPPAHYPDSHLPAHFTRVSRSSVLPAHLVCPPARLVISVTSLSRVCDTHRGGGLVFGAPCLASLCVSPVCFV